MISALALALVQAQPQSVARVPEPPSSMQWLYGSGEGAAASLQAYRALRAHALAAMRGRPRDSVVLAPGTTIDAPRFIPCANKPRAVVLDIDETALQNLGYERALALAGKTSDGRLLDVWQKAPRREAAAMPGAVAALNALRARGLAVIFNSNRDRADAAATAQTLVWAGLGPAVPGKTLLMRGDVDGKGGKDGRRSYIGARYCVVAMAGDQLADFADGFNDKRLSPLQRRERASTGALGNLWGNGWFMLSNPVYGPGLDGNIDEVFGPAARWQGEGR